jgi:hypothetical protein
MAARSADRRRVSVGPESSWSPANAKNELVKHIEQHDPKRTQLIAGVEAVDPPSDSALVAHAQKYFRAADRMLRAIG